MHREFTANQQGMVEEITVHYRSNLVLRLINVCMMEKIKRTIPLSRILQRLMMFLSLQDYHYQYYGIKFHIRCSLWDCQ